MNGSMERFSHFTRFCIDCQHYFVNPNQLYPMVLMDPASWLFVLFISIVCSIACTIISKKKGYSVSQVFTWLATGFFFNVFALIAIILAPHRNEP